VPGPCEVERSQGGALWALTTQRRASLRNPGLFDLYLCCCFIIRGHDCYAFADIMTGSDFDDVDTLEEYLVKGLATLRVLDESSLSPLEDDAFTATHPTFQPSPSGRTRRLLHQPVALSGDLQICPTAGQDVIRHVTGGWNRKGDGMPSNWISTTASLEWAIREIARRLTILCRFEFDMTVIGRTTYMPRYRGTRQVTIDTTDFISDFCEDDARCTAHGRNHAKALRLARSSMEVLYFGKIFPRHVWRTTTWTSEVGDISALPRQAVQDGLCQLC